MKKVLLFVLMAAFVTVSACKKKDTVTPPVDGGASVGVEVSKIDTMKVGTISGVLSNANQKTYAEGKKGSFMAGTHLKAKTAACVDCHGEAGLLNDSEMQTNVTCISCHGTLEDMALITNKSEINPHESHLGKINCTSCHGGHEPSVLYCNYCHSFDVKIPSEGEKPLLRQIDIEKYNKANSKTVEKTDVLVIGAGGSGHIAAITANGAGAKVILLEKMPISGGNSQLAAGGMNAAETTYQKNSKITDTKESMYEDTMKGGKNLSKPELVKVLANKSAESMEWLDSIGSKLSAVNMGGGAANKRFHAPEGGSAVGSYLVNIYKAVAEKEGLDIRLNSPAVRLLLDKNGAVYGAVVDGKHSGLYEIHAKSVILTTGGFSANATRVESYQPNYKGMTTSNQPGATGDGLDLAKEAGADFVDMKQIQIHPSIAVGSNTLITEAVRGVGAVMVNHDGKRFYDELSTRDKVSAAILEQNGKTAWLILDDNIRKSLKQIEGYFHLNLAKEAKSLDELAKMIKVPAENLKKSIAEYNKAVETKVDTFGKKTLEKKVEVPNFVAIEIAPGIHYTMGGVSFSPSSQVLNKDGKPIPNFYAAGEVTGGLHGANRLGGNSISETVTFGRIAGEQAALNALGAKK